MPTKLVVDCSTGITTEVELTAEEIAQAEADAKLSAQAKLAALGLSGDEIAAITK